jgi:hypothetical protein
MSAPVPPTGPTWESQDDDGREPCLGGNGCNHARQCRPPRRAFYGGGCTCDEPDDGTSLHAPGCPLGELTGFRR